MGREIKSRQGDSFKKRYTYDTAYLPICSPKMQKYRLH
jgi:hypothetical protein